MKEIIMTTPPDPFRRPRAMPLRALGLSLIIPGAYSGLGQVLGEAILLGCFLVLASMALVYVCADTADRFGLRLLIAIVGGVLGVLTLWGVWYGLEFGWPALMALKQLHPVQAVEMIVALSDEITYIITRDETETAYGTTTTKAVWLIETAVFGLSPLIGAWAGTRFAKNMRRAAAGKSPI